MENVVVTGASTGIGFGIVEYLIARGYRVWGTVRKQADAERLAQQFGDGFGALMMDVTDHESVFRAAEELKGQIGDQGLAALVNNAGVAIGGPLLEIPLEEFRRQIDINVLGVLASVQAFAPLLGASLESTTTPGKVIQISSISSAITYPFFGPYSTSKGALERINDALRRELAIYGIDVISILPGPVATPIWDKAQEQDTGQYEDSDYAEALGRVMPMVVQRGQTGIPVEVIADRVHQILGDEHPKTRYVITPNRLKNWVLPRFLPDRMLDRIIWKTIGMKIPD